MRHIGLNRLNDIKVNSSYAFLRSYYERLSQPDNLPMQRNSFKRGLVVERDHYNKIVILNINKK